MPKLGEGNRETLLCPCGKPADHVDADPAGPDWACRVPAPVGADTTNKTGGLIRDVPTL